VSVFWVEIVASLNCNINAVEKVSVNLEVLLLGYLFCVMDYDGQLTEPAVDAAIELQAALI
jgi:hypothetical protein